MKQDRIKSSDIRKVLRKNDGVVVSLHLNGTEPLEGRVKYGSGRIGSTYFMEESINGKAGKKKTQLPGHYYIQPRADNPFNNKILLHIPVKGVIGIESDESGIRGIFADYSSGYPPKKIDGIMMFKNG